MGQKYDPHHDFFYDQINARPEHGGQRIATVLMYLCALASSSPPPKCSRKVKPALALAPRTRLLDIIIRAAINMGACHGAHQVPHEAIVLAMYFACGFLAECFSALAADMLCDHRTTPDEGGETVFPQAGSPPVGPGWSDCARQVRLWC